MSYSERAREVISQVDIGLGALPELDSTRSSLEERNAEFNSNPERFITHLYLEYLRVIRDLATLPSEDLSTIAEANKLSALQNISSNSAAHGGADYFLSILGPERQSELYAIVQKSADPNSPVFQSALADLSGRMTKGHLLAIAGEKIADGASAEADYAIWGHTKGLAPHAMIHFIMCHFLERTFTAEFAGDDDEAVRTMAAQKDTLLSAMGDVLLLRNAQGQANPELMAMWETSRREGGLQWITPQRKDLFAQAVSSSSNPIAK